MTTTTPEGFAALIRPHMDRLESLPDEQGGTRDLDAGTWLMYLFDVWERWPCSDEGCPARPGWDVARSDMFEALAPKADGLVRDMLDTLVATVAEAFAEYAKVHPDAPLRQTEGKAA